MLVFSVREEMILQEKLEMDRLTSSMLSTLINVAKKISEVECPPHGVREISCFLASPWSVSKTQVSKKNFDSVTQVTESILEDIYQQEEKDFIHQENPIAGDADEVFRIENIHTKLNGYETCEPRGKSAGNIEVVLHVSVCPKKILEALKNKIGRYFPGDNIKYHSFPFAAFVVVRDLFHEKNFLLLDISGENTDVVIVKNNILEETLPFSAGKNFLLRELSNKLNITPVEAVSQFRLAESEMLHEAARKEVAEASAGIGRDWRRELEKTLEKMILPNDFLPHDVFVMSDDGVSRWFIENIQDEGLAQFTLADDIFTTRYLNTPFLSSFCNFEKGITRDPFLMIEGIFLSRSLH